MRRMGVGLAVIAMVAGLGVVGLRAQGTQSEIVRRAKSKVQPEYPELARKMNITGTVRIEVVVAANGTVKDAKIMGGHPVLATAAKASVTPAALLTISSGVAFARTRGSAANSVNKLAGSSCGGA